MNFIQILRSNIIYFLLGLPLFIVLYEFFLTCSMGNRNIMILLIGQLAIVPIVSFLMLFLNKFLNNWVGTLIWFLISAFFIYASYFIFNDYQFTTAI
jgi:hypothetical protein